MRYLATVILLLFVCFVAEGQDVYDRQEMNIPFEDDFRDIVVDTTLYYNTLGGNNGIFRSLAKYGFSFISYRSRGVDDRFNRVSASGLELSSGIGKYPDYALYTALGSSVSSIEYGHYDFPSGLRSPVESETYDIRASSASAGIAATYVFSQKRYGTGIRIRAAGGLGKGWNYAVSLRGRWGNDHFIQGVFTDAVTVAAGIDKKFRRGVVLSLFTVAAPQERGMKGWTENAVYRLTGNNLYNPYWGRFEGRIRNARINRDCTPLIIATIDIPGIKNKHSYTLTAGYRFGERSKSGLTWFGGGSNPAPDYYTKLPSYITQPHIIERMTAAWQSNEESVTQIDWHSLYETNLFATDGKSKYIQDERIESLDNFQLAFSGRSKESNRQGIAYGVRLRSDHSNFFRRIKDMLGAVYIPNRDPFTGVESDMRNPGRKVGKEEAFDYDYDIYRREAAAYISGHYRNGRWNASLNAEVGVVSLERNGHFEKEGLPGKLSYGSSGTKDFPIYNISLCGRYYFTAGHHVSLSFLYGSYAPQYEHIFLSPDYCNTLITSPKSVSITGLNIDYRIPISYFAEAELSGYIMSSAGESDITGYYDDFYGVYSILVMENLRKFNWGVEAGIKVNITEKLIATAGISIGNYAYHDMADVTIYEDSSRKILIDNDKAYLKGFIHSETPQTLGAINIAYDFPKNWRADAEWLYTGRSYVSINPLRRTNRIASLMTSPESSAYCVTQERLPSASVFNIGVTKGFNFVGMRFFASISINNIFGSDDIIYGGYEPMRFLKSKSSGKTQYAPFPARYSYSYPRTFLASLTCSF